MEWMLVKVGEGVSYVCQLLAGQSQVFIVGVMVGGIIVATGDEIKGKASMKNALMGYLVVKFTPQLFDFLDGLSFFK